MKPKKYKIQPKGNSYDGSSEYIEKQNHSIIIIIAIGLIGITIGLIIYRSLRSKTCNNIEKLILTNAENYAEKNNLLPEIEGESITINIDDIFKNETLKPSLKEQTCSGTIKFTKYKEEYIKTFDITNCNYCSTNTRYQKWSKETNKKPSSKYLIDVIPYYNYYEISSYRSAWSNWIPEDELGEIDENYFVALPKDKNQLPNIPEEANITDYEKDDETWYSYRDKKWKYYQDKGGNYSDFFSEQPNGYSKKDTSTEISTEWTEWSLDYPEKKSYRTIGTTTGYRWYYEKKGKKIYWNSGNYTPEQPDKKYDKKEEVTTTMYRYKDKKWRWYNGEKRSYTGYVSVPSSSAYNKCDEGLLIYTDWSIYTDKNRLDNTNSWYREQKEKTYSRFRTLYTMKSFLKLDKYVDKQEFEKTLNDNIPNLVKQENFQIDIHYKFKYRKK